jgi:hypothetical protein
MTRQRLGENIYKLQIQKIYSTFFVPKIYKELYNSRVKEQQPN